MEPLAQMMSDDSGVREGIDFIEKQVQIPRYRGTGKVCPREGQSTKQQDRKTGMRREQ
jgi:hypothetical protein